MTVRENIQIFHQIEVKTYLEILKTEHGAKDHPAQPGCYLADELPFYKPKQTDEYVFILGFNYLDFAHFKLSNRLNPPGKRK